MQHIGYWRRKENLEFCPSGFGKWQGLGFRVSGFEVGRVKVLKFLGGFWLESTAFWLQCLECRRVWGLGVRVRHSLPASALACRDRNRTIGGMCPKGPSIILVYTYRVL